jgi:polyisoprenoid-binding protein YceI
MNKKTLIGGALAAVAILGIAVWWFVFKGDAPDAVSVDDANAQLDEDLAAEDLAAEDIAAAGFDGDINGTWIIDDEIGTFDFETASGSFAGFRVDEELTIGAVTAVGRTGGVTGALTIDGGTLSAADIAVDMNTIVSNDSRRERAIRNTIDATNHPTGTFALTQSVELPAGLASGDQVTVDAVGDLTINGATNEVTFAITALIREDGFGIVTGSVDVVWQDFNITPPSAPVVVSIADEGVLEFQLVVAKR